MKQHGQSYHNADFLPAVFVQKTLTTSLKLIAQIRSPDAISRFCNLSYQEAVAQ